MGLERGLHLPGDRLADSAATVIADAPDTSAFADRSRSGLSTELNEKAGRRLAWVALAYLIIYMVASVQDVLDLFWRSDPEQCLQ